MPTVVQIATISLDDTSQYLPLSKIFIGDKAERFLDGNHELDANEIRTFHEVCNWSKTCGTKEQTKC